MINITEKLWLKFLITFSQQTMEATEVQVQSWNIKHQLIVSSNWVSFSFKYRMLIDTNSYWCNRLTLVLVYMLSNNNFLYFNKSAILNMWASYKLILNVLQIPLCLGIQKVINLLYEQGHTMEYWEEYTFFGFSFW